MNNNTNADFDAVLIEFYNYLSDVMRLYEDSIPTLKAKLDAIASDDIGALNKCIQSQQVFVLKTKTFDNKIADYQARLGITARNLTDMIGQLPGDNRLMFYDLLGQFDIILKSFKFHNEKCQALLNTKLYSIDKKLKRLQVKTDTTMYRDNAREAQPSTCSKSFETRI